MEKRITVVTPTYNRPYYLTGLLTSLFEKCDASQFDMVVVIDQKEWDNYDEVIKEFSEPAYPITYTRPDKFGSAATARNAGARKVESEYVLFLDDDLVITSDLISAHLEMLEDHDNHVCIGPYYPIPVKKMGYLEKQSDQWWRSKFKSLEGRDSYGYLDFLSANMSMSLETFNKIGGFNETLKNAGGEDYEFGCRAVLKGVKLLYSDKATTDHNCLDYLTLSTSFHRANNAGKAIRHIEALYGDELDIPRESRSEDIEPTKRYWYLKMKKSPWVKGLLMPLFKAFLPISESLGMYKAWKKVYTSGWIMEYYSGYNEQDKIETRS